MPPFSHPMSAVLSSTNLSMHTRSVLRHFCRLFASILQISTYQKLNKNGAESDDAIKAKDVIRQMMAVAATCGREQQHIYRMSVTRYTMTVNSGKRPDPFFKYRNPLQRTYFTIYKIII